MRLAVSITGAALALVAFVAEAQPKGKVEPSLEAAHKKFTDAFNSFDPKAVAAWFAEDGTLITPVGDVAHGREEIAKLYGENVERMFRGSTSTFTITGVRMAGPGFQWLDVDHEVQNARRPDGTTGPMRMHVVMLAQKKGSDWKWLEVRPYVFVPRDQAHSGAMAPKQP
jgi:uncharacterized protein (TIGR02246 family)